MRLISQRVYYSGRVQGVGFRHNTTLVAADFRVTGYVRNLPGGQVELVAQGEPEEVERFLDAVARRMDGYIRSFTRQDAETDTYPDFSVR